MCRNGQRTYADNIMIKNKIIENEVQEPVEEKIRNSGNPVTEQLEGYKSGKRLVKKGQYINNMFLKKSIDWIHFNK